MTPNDLVNSIFVNPVSREGYYLGIMSGILFSTLIPFIFTFYEFVLKSIFTIIVKLLKRPDLSGAGKVSDDRTV